MSSPARVLYWFRTDLPSHDSPALKAALKIENVEALYLVWCFDPEYVWKHKVGVNRWQFLLESMQDTSDALHTLNSKQKLLVLRGSPEKVLPVAWKSWGITHMVFEKDTAAYARRRDEHLISLAKASFPALQIIIKMGHNLLDPEAVVKKGNNGKAVTTLLQWKKAAAKVGEIPKPVPPPISLPDPGAFDLYFSAVSSENAEAGSSGLKGHTIDTDSNTLVQTNGKGKEMQGPMAVLNGVNVNGEIMDQKRFDVFNMISGPSGGFAVPTLDSLGLPPVTTSIHGGETAARQRFDAFFSDHSRVATFAKPQTAPTSLEPSTTLLSPYLKFGCLSVREFYWRAKEVSEAYEPKKGEKVTKEPENLMGQLEFRDMYYCAEYGTAHYDRIHGSSLSRFMAWGLVNKYDSDGSLILPRPRGNERDEERFAAWKEGRTGFPWIDAVMRQLKHEGWIHHLARHSVACFITRGQCYISWERGAEVFDEYLLDWDPASNPGNWMWLSCSAFFAQYYRVYGLVSWPQKTDKHGELVRKYCPELAKFPDKYIYEPHKAPPEVQKSAHCIIGEDYPHPLLDEHVEKDRCIARLKIAFAAGMHGDHPRVLDGTAEIMLKERYLEAHGHEEDDVDEGGAFRKPAKGQKRKPIVASGPMDGFVKRAKNGL